MKSTFDRILEYRPENRARKNRTRDKWLVALPAQLLMALLLVIGVPLCAFAIPVAIEDAHTLDLGGAIQYVEDANHTQTIDTIRQAGIQWQGNNDHIFNHGYNNSTWWLKLTLRNNLDGNIQKLLEIGYAVLDYVDVYIVANDKLIKSYQMGDKLPFSQRPVEHRYFVLPISWQPNQNLDIYIRLKSTSSIQAPLTLYDYQSFDVANTMSAILQGFYYGGMVIIAIYNMLIFFVLRSRNYLYYTGLVLSMPLFLASMSGHAFHYLWPEATSWNDHAIVVFLASALTFGAIFTRRFLRIQEISRPLALFLMALASVNGTMCLLSFFLPYHICIEVLVLLGILSCSSELGISIYALIRKQNSASTYLTGWFFFLSGSLVLALNKAAILPNNLFTEYAVQIGSMMEAVLLSLALAQRINIERRLRYEAQTETLIATRKVNEELEQRVSERTAELEELNHKLRELSDTDQLTGLKNRRFLEHYLTREWARALRYRHALTVVLIDIDHFKAVNDNYGHPAGDACLQQVAKLIGLGLRWPTDVAARYGGEEFCLILPETTAEGATTVIERIRVRVAQAVIDAERKQFQVTISAGVFCAIPEQGSTMETFISNADKALYQSKQAGRNQVTVAA